jgi:hypothetical protein
MATDLWKSGWQEDAFARGQKAFTDTPAWYRNLSPADVAEDAYLLGWASTLLVRDGVPQAPGRPPAAPPPQGEPAPVVAVPAFPYERCLKPGGESSRHFADALAGRSGALHRAAAVRAGGEEAWCGAVAGLHRAGALRTTCPEDPPLHTPPLSTFGEDFQACAAAVGRKTLHAFKIGFGLWGRWEAP